MAVPVASRLTGLVSDDALAQVKGLYLGAVQDADVSAVPAFLNASAFDEAVTRFGASWEGQDRRGLITQYSKYWLRAAVAPNVICAAAGRKGPAMEISALGVWHDAAGVPMLMALEDHGIGESQMAGDETLARLMTDHLDPVLTRFSAWSGLSTKVFWANAGNLIDALLAHLCQEPATAKGAARLAAIWLEQRQVAQWPGRNPLYRPVVRANAADGTITRRRRVCCARYLLPDLALCGSCPLSKAAAARLAKITDDSGPPKSQVSDGS